jgi:pimeloyl-ACP methyl ester carboxylesterase
MPAPVALGIASNSAHSSAKRRVIDGAHWRCQRQSPRMCEAVTITHPCLKQATAFIVAATLFCGFLAITNAQPALAGATVQRAAVPASSDRPKAAGDAVAPAPPSIPGSAEPSTAAAPDLSRTRVYLFRGALGLIFSRGMDKLATRVQRMGATVHVYEFTLCGLIASTAIEDYKRDPFPIILMGHSMGGRCALQFSETLKAEGIPVSLVVTIDPAHMSPSVPTNVARFINIFLSKDVLGGGDIKPVEGFRGAYASYDLQQHDEVKHINIDKMDALHQQLAAKVAEVAAAGGPSEGDNLPLRYAVPPKADVELWDSGMAIAARSGDTLQTLAAQYRLPLWALAQLNQLPDNIPLGAGQRVVVPRHLASPAGAPEPVSSQR